MFLLYFVARKQWRHLGATVAVVTLGTILGIGVFGIDTYQAHFSRLMLSFRDHDQFFTGLPAMQAWVGALFVSHPLYNPVPVADLSAIALPAILASGFGLLWLALRKSGADTHRAFLATLVLSVMFTPLAAEHHYVLLSVPLAVIIADQIESGTTLSIVCSLVAAVLILGWLPAMPIATHPGFTKFLCFGRLYGAIGLLALLLIPPKPLPAMAALRER